MTLYRRIFRIVSANLNKVERSIGTKTNGVARNAAFLFGPHDMWGGTSRLFDTGKEGRYKFLFGDGDGIWTTVPDEEFPHLAGIWFVCEYVRGLWKSEKEKRANDEVAGLALERRYMAYAAVANY